MTPLHCVPVPALERSCPRPCLFTFLSSPISKVTLHSRCLVGDPWPSPMRKWPPKSLKILSNQLATFNYQGSFCKTPNILASWVTKPNQAGRLGRHGTRLLLTWGLSATTVALVAFWAAAPTSTLHSGAPLHRCAYSGELPAPACPGSLSGSH